MTSGLLEVWVQPRAGRDELEGWQGQVLRVRVRAAPTGGEANRAVAALLAAAAGLPASAVELVRGTRSRRKLFRVGRLSVADLRGRLGGDGDAGRAAAPPADRAAQRGRAGRRP